MTAWMGARRGRGQGERPLLTAHLERLPALVRGGCGGGRAILCTPGRTGAVSSGTKAGPPLPMGLRPPSTAPAQGPRQEAEEPKGGGPAQPPPRSSRWPSSRPPRPPYEVRPAHPRARGLCRGQPYLVSSGSSSIKPDSHLGQM